jgi:hypothetical protein
MAGKGWVTSFAEPTPQSKFMRQPSSICTPIMPQRGNLSPPDHGRSYRTPLIDSMLLTRLDVAISGEEAIR